MIEIIKTIKDMDLNELFKTNNIYYDNPLITKTIDKELIERGEF